MTRNIYGDALDDQGRPSSSGDSAVRNLAVFAQMRLEKLAEPHEIRPFRAGDEQLLCAFCLFSVEEMGHSASEVAQLRAILAAHDDRKQP